MLDPPASQVANGQVAPDIQALKDDFYSKTLRDFLEQWVDALLLKKMDEESLAKRNLKLLDIIKNAGELASVCGSNGHTWLSEKERYLGLSSMSSHS